MSGGGRDFSSRARVPVGQRWSWLWVAGGLLTVALSLAATVRAGLAYRHAAASLAQVRRDTEAAALRAQALQARPGADEQLAQKALYTAEAPPPRVVSELAGLLPAEARLEGLSLNYGSRLEVELEVAARTPAAYDAFLDRLEGSPLFTDVLPGDEDRAGEVRASIHAVYRGAGS